MFWLDDAVKKMLHEIVGQLGRPLSQSEEAKESLEATELAEFDSLHICPECRGAFVFPIDALEVDEWQYAVTLCCANCDAERVGIYDDGELEQLDLAMDESMRALIAFHDKLQRFNERDEVDRFVAAINADQILPEDF